MSSPEIQAGARDGASATGHVTALDGIRGVAIVLVMIGHLFPSNNVSPNVFMSVLLDLRNITWVGVNLFFALSGFLITGILYDTRDTPQYFRSFFGRRTLRIFPLYYGFLLVLLALTPFLHFDWHGTALRYLTYTQNIPFHDISEVAPPATWIVVRHFWSLAVEEQFYIVWPFLLFWLRSWRRIFLAILAGSAIALALRTWLAVTGQHPANHSTPFCMDALFLGGALALLVRSRYRDIALRLGFSIFAIAGVIILIPTLRNADFSWETSFFLTTIGMTIINVGATALIAAALRDGSATKRIFSASWLRFFGKYSYGLYIYHYSLAAICIEPLRHVCAAHGIGRNAAILVSGLVPLALAIVAALISYHAWEAPFLRLKRLFPYTRSHAA